MNFNRQPFRPPNNFLPNPPCFPQNQYPPRRDVLFPPPNFPQPRALPPYQPPNTYPNGGLGMGPFPRNYSHQIPNSLSQAVPAFSAGPLRPPILPAPHFNPHPNGGMMQNFGPSRGLPMQSFSVEHPCFPCPSHGGPPAFPVAPQNPTGPPLNTNIHRPPLQPLPNLSGLPSNSFPHSGPSQIIRAPPQLVPPNPNISHGQNYVREMSPRPPLNFPSKPQNFQYPRQNIPPNFCPPAHSQSNLPVPRNFSAPPHCSVSVPPCGPPPGSVSLPPCSLSNFTAPPLNEPPPFFISPPPSSGPPRCRGPLTIPPSSAFLPPIFTVPPPVVTTSNEIPVTREETITDNKHAYSIQRSMSRERSTSSRSCRDRSPRRERSRSSTGRSPSPLGKSRYSSRHSRSPSWSSSDRYRTSVRKPGSPSYASSSRSSSTRRDTGYSSKSSCSESSISLLKRKQIAPLSSKSPELASDSKRTNLTSVSSPSEKPQSEREHVILSYKSSRSPIGTGKSTHSPPGKVCSERDPSSCRNSSSPNVKAIHAADSSSRRKFSRSMSRRPLSSKSPTFKRRPSSQTSLKTESEEGGKPHSSERTKLEDDGITEDQAINLEKAILMKPEEIMEIEKAIWVRSAPADLYYTRDKSNIGVMTASPRLNKLCEDFDSCLVQRACKVIAGRSPNPVDKLCAKGHHLHHHHAVSSDSDREDGEIGSEESESDEEKNILKELEKKKNHPHRLHPELWYNDVGQMNDGPLCRCSPKARRTGIRHGIYTGEDQLERCDPNTNNANRLYHYRITLSPPTNFLTKTPTTIHHDEHEFIFEGFSLFSHHPLKDLPTCKVIRFNIEYTILYIEEPVPENYTVKELELFFEYLFHELLELEDLDFHAAGDKTGCPIFHIMPRFVRELPENGKEVLSVNVVLQYLLDSSKPLVNEDELADMYRMTQFQWQSNFVDKVKGMVVTYPGKKPCSIRVDQLDRHLESTEKGSKKMEDDNKEPTEDNKDCPIIVHFGIRPQQLSYAGNPDYQKAWRDYVKYRHLIANMSKPTFEDKRKLQSKENRLQDMRLQNRMKRDVTVTVSSKGFWRTGIMCDIVQHAMLLPVLVCHLRFHRSLDFLEEKIDYTFKNRAILQLAVTHPSYRENFGTNPDHARNSLTNSSIRQPEYGDRRIHFLNTRKRGINTLISIMSRFGHKQETESTISHNERLEFLGDAVVELITSIHLFHIFPDLEEGGLATYRAALVQNQHLALLANKLNLHHFMLYAHGSDLCHDLELKHAMANCFEALMGALFLDGGIEAADKVFSKTLYGDDLDVYDMWVNYPLHPIQEQEPEGDRKWIDTFPVLKELTNFEDATGIVFNHIRLLARAFTDRSIGYNNLTLGSNQRLEFLGDTVLQLISSDYLYRHFPEHHEGHLSLLRSSLVNNRTQAVVCNDLGMTKYALYSNPKAELKTKDRADLLEALLGAIYVDQGMDVCETFCNVCFFPRLQDFILNQDWNDPKSKLQQCCLTLRTIDGGEPDIPIYKVIECQGPTNTRMYSVAVYFRGERLAAGTGHSIQQAEMSAAKEALDKSPNLFRQLVHQRHVIARSVKRQTVRRRGRKSYPDSD